jgi:hypothetical protein
MPRVLQQTFRPKPKRLKSGVFSCAKYIRKKTIRVGRSIGGRTTQLASLTIIFQSAKVGPAGRIALN